MMKAFMLEWWDESQGRYQQEYYSSIIVAAKRYQMLADSVKDSNPEISTIHIDMWSGIVEEEDNA